MITRFFDPFRDFEFWRTASVDEVRGEIDRGAQIGTFPSCASYSNLPTSNFYYDVPLAEFGELVPFGGLTLLHWAVAGGASAEVVEYLLTCGVPVDAHDRQDVSGATALHSAAQQGDVEVAKLLLEWGASLEALSDLGTPLYWAVAGPDPKRIVIVSDRYGKTIENAADGGVGFVLPPGWLDDPIFESELFQRKPRGGVSVHREHLLVYVGPTPGPNLSMVEMLLRRGADTEYRDRWDRTILHFAASDTQYPEVVACLIDRGADVTAVANDGHHNHDETVFDFAARNDNLEIFGTVLSMACHQFPNENGMSVLHVGAQSRWRTVVIKYLLEHGYQVNEVDSLGRTPLHYAAGAAPRINEMEVMDLYDVGEEFNAAQPEVVHQLLLSGADPTIRDHLGHRPVDYCDDEEATRALM